MSELGEVIRLPKRKKARGRVRREDAPAEIIIANIPTRLDLPCERILNHALDTGLESVVVMGWDKDGEFYFAHSSADGGEVLWLIEGAKRALLDY